MQYQASRSSKRTKPFWQALSTSAIALSLAIAGTTASEWLATSPTSPTLRIAAAKDAGVRVAERAGQSVVTIRSQAGYGSGSIIRKDGLVLTNAHVVKEQRVVTVTLKDGRTLTGDVVAYGKECLDLALVKLRNPSNLPTIDIAQSDRVQQGQQVFAIGSPGLLDNSMTSGIVSRIISKDGLIQTDTSIRPGNSGGPLLNSDGAIIGVNTFIRPEQNAAFAISTDRVQAFLKDYDQGKAPTQPNDAIGQSKNVQTVSIPATRIQGALNSKSGVLCKTGSLFNEYTFQGKAGQQVLISVSSQDFAPALTVYAPDGRYKTSSVGRGRTATLITDLPRTGTYRVIANSSQPKQFGAYTLNVTPVVFWRSDRLQTGDPITPDGKLYREYSFQGKANQEITVVASSSQFDTHLCLSDATGKLLGCNDNESFKSTNSALKLRLPQTGAYKLKITPAKPGRGAFTVTVQ